MGTKTVLRNLWIVIALLGIAAMVYASVHMATIGVPAFEISLWAAGLFVFLAVPISLFGIVLHLNNYTDAVAQRYVIRIMWMVPIYSLTSWLALTFYGMAIYLDVVRECYEAYVIYSFTFYLIHVVGKNYEEGQEFASTSLACAAVLARKPVQAHMMGLKYCLRPWYFFCKGLEYLAQTAVRLD